MMNDNNPVPVKWRGWFYVAGMGIGILGTIAGPLEIALHLGNDWSAVITSALGGLMTFSNTLSRSNLSAKTAAPIEGV